VAAVGIVGSVMLAAGLAGRWPGFLPWAIAALGGQYAASLLARDGGIDELAPLYAAALLVIAELAYWGLELSPVVSGRPEVVGRIVRLAGLWIGAAAVGAAILAASEGGGGGGLELQLLGLLAAAGTLGLLAAQAWRSRRR
jgi:hypothetical protein